MSPSEWAQLVENWRNVEDLDRSMEACQTIAEINDQSYVPRLYELLNDEDFYIRETAAEPLANLEGVKALPALFRAITQGEKDCHDNDSLSHFVIELLEREAGKVAPLLLEMIKDQDESVRANAAWALGFVASEITVAPLLEALDDKNGSVRSAVAGSLASFKDDPKILAALVNMLLDKDEQVRISAISSLGYFGDQRAIQPLRMLLESSSKNVKRFIEEALRQLETA